MLTPIQRRSLTAALSHYGDTQPLPTCELPELIRQAQAADARARHKLILSYVRLVAKAITRTRIPQHLDVQDVLQAGLLSISRAIGHLNPERPPGPYLALVAKRAVFEAVGQDAAPFTPRRQQPRTVTVDQPISPASNLTWADILQDEETEPGLETQRDAVRREIERALAVLEPRQEWAIRARFGLLPAPCLPLDVRESGDTTLDERLDDLERAVACEVLEAQTAAAPARPSKQIIKQSGTADRGPSSHRKGPFRSRAA
jgi:RNA polymerase sigma factor (sigma-70 family)